MKSSLFSLIGIFFAFFLLSACGSSDSSDEDGFDGETSAATADVDNQEALAVAAAEASKQAVNSDQGPNLPLAVDIRSNLLDIAENAKETIIASQLASGVVIDVSEICTGGGTASVDTNTSATPQEVPTSGNWDIEYSNCDTGNGTIDGTMDYTFSNSFQNVTIVYDIDFTTTEGSFSLSGTITCNNEECTYTEDFSVNGVDYRIENIEVSEDIDGFNISGRVFDENLGYIDFETSDFTACSNGNVQTGTITISDSTNTEVITVTFPNCNDCIVTFDGVETTFQQ